MPIKEESLEANAGQKHPVPQNVMDVEFKVVGDLTLRQVMYIAFGGVIAYFLYKTGIPNFWKYILMAISLVTGTAVAFVPIQERGLDKWLVIFINSIVNPTQMIWRKSVNYSSVSFLSNYDQLQIIKNEMVSLTPIKNRNRLEEYLGMIENTEESNYDNFETTRMGEIQKNLRATSTVNVTTTYEETPSLEPVIPTIDKARIPERTHERSVVVEPQKAPPTLHKSTIAEDELESKKELLNALATIEGGYNQDGPIEIFTEQKVNRPILNLPSLGSNNFSLKGEIKLKNTRKFPSIIVAEDIKDIKEQEESLEKKVSELLVLAKKARAQYQIKGGKEPTFNTPIVEDVKGRISQLREEKKKLKIEIDKSTEQVNLIDNTNKSRETLQNQIQMLTHKNEELETLLKKINFELDELKGTPEHKSSNQTESEIKVVPEEAKNEEVFIPSKPTENQVDEFKLKSRPSPNNSYLNNNIIEGLIKDMSGKLVEGAAVIIKDSQGNVIRALKTNQIGQFRTQTSVPNGKYSIEVLKGGMSFDIIIVEAVGRLMNPIYLVAKNSK